MNMRLPYRPVTYCQTLGDEIHEDRLKRRLPTKEQLTLFEEGPALSEWMEGLPPVVGWWETKYKKLAEGKMPLPSHRRYFDGKKWSLAVLLGTDDELTAMYSRHHARTQDFIYRGLANPPS